MKKIMGMLAVMAAMTILPTSPLLAQSTEEETDVVIFNESFDIRSSANDSVNMPATMTPGVGDVAQNDPNYYRSVKERWTMIGGWNGVPGSQSGGDQDAFGGTVSFYPLESTNQLVTDGFIQTRLVEGTVNDWVIMKDSILVTGDIYIVFYTKNGDYMYGYPIPLELWYGTTPDPGEQGTDPTWVCFDTIDCYHDMYSPQSALNEYGWVRHQSANLPVSEGQTLYFAFRVNIPDNTSFDYIFLQMDEFSIHQGKSVVYPNLILTDLYAPNSGCGLADEEISLRLQVMGAAVNSIACQANVYYEAATGDSLVSVLYDTIRETVRSGAYATMTFSERADFSRVGDYRVQAFVSLIPTAAYSEDTILRDNSLTSELRNLEPLELPVDHNFGGAGASEVADLWAPEVEGTWQWTGGDWKVSPYNNKGEALVSTCIYFPEGDYVFRYNIVGGRFDTWYQTLYAEDYEIRLGNMATDGDDPSQWPIIYEEDDLYTEVLGFGNDEFFRFKVEEAGNYQIAIRNTTPSEGNEDDYKEFRVVSLYIDEAGGDLSLGSIGSNIMAYRMPKDQLSREIPFQAVVRNMGLGDMQGQVVLMMNQDTVGKSAAFTVKQDSTTNVTVNMQLTPSVLNRLSFEDPNAADNTNTVKSYVMATGENEDTYAGNDEGDDIRFIMTDSTWGIDHSQGTENGMYVMQNAAGLATQFTLSSPDTLTSVTISFSAERGATVPPDTYLMDDPCNLEIVIAPIDLTDNFTGDPLYRTDWERPRGVDTLHTFTFPAMILPAGDYIIGVVQHDANDLACIRVDDVSYYDTRSMSISHVTKNYRAWPQTGSIIGNWYIRPNFGHNAQVSAVDASLLSINLPDSAVYSSAESFTATVSNVGMDVLENITVYCDVDGTVTSAVVESLAVHGRADVEFTADLSALGVHNIKVYTAVPEDTRTSNDTLLISTQTVAALSPYVLNFEACQPLATKYLNPAWQFVDVDGFPVWYHPDLPVVEPYAPLGFIVEGLNAYMQSFEGQNFAVSLAPEALGNRGEDWIVSPALAMAPESKLTFYSNHPEGTGTSAFEVYVSREGNSLEQLEAGEMVFSGFATEGEWGIHEVSLADYSEGDIYIGICLQTTRDAIVTAVDNIVVSNSSRPESNEDVTEDASVRLFPNPALDYVMVNAMSEITRIEIISLEGRAVYDNRNVAVHNYRLETSSLESGLYFVKVTTKQGISVQKLVVR